MTRLMRTAALTYPTKPRYEDTFDLQKVFNSINTWSKSLPLDRLTRKTAFLLSARAIMRSSDLARIATSSIIFGVSSVTFFVIQPKEATLTDPHRKIELHCTKPSSTCAVCTLRHYIQRTSSQRQQLGQDFDRLFLSLSRTTKVVQSQTISNWLTTVLSETGVDTSTFKAHSIRSAAATFQLKTGKSVDQVMATAHWKSRSVFTKFYDRSNL
jgi:hypothetical protein